MNYYKRHLGDYAKDTRHLSLAEHGAFTLLLDYYYATEKPIPDDRCERIANAYAESERQAVRTILKEFFVETPDGWRNAKADEVIAEAQAKSLKAKQSAMARWGESECEGNANALETHSERNASHKPLATNKEDGEPGGSLPAAGSPPDCPQAEIVALYHELLPAHRRMRVWDGERAKSLRARWREDPKRQSLDYWRRFFAYVATSPFLTGQVEAKDRPPFVADLEWLVTKKNFIKVIERKYHDGGQS